MFRIMKFFMNVTELSTGMKKFFQKRGFSVYLFIVKHENVRQIQPLAGKL